MNSLSEDLSFVILGQGSIPPSLTDEDPRTYQDTNSVIDSSLDVQKRLDILLQENRELRDALNQNNLAMKAQFETLSMWQQEVLRTHKSHQEKFAETRQLLLNLKAENVSLKTSLANGPNEPSLQNYQQKIDRLTAENGILVKEREAFREECTRLTLKIVDLENMVRQKTNELLEAKQNPQSSIKPDNRSNNDLRLGSMTQESMTSWINCDNSQSSIEKSLEEKPKSSYDDLVEENKKRLEEIKLLGKCLYNAEEKVAELLKFKEEAATNNELMEAELQQEKEKCKTLQMKSEEFEILKAQVEIYKSDYEEEREARRKMVDEKEKLAEEVRLLKVCQANSASTSHTPENSASASAPSVFPEEATLEGLKSAAEPVVESKDDLARPFQCPLCHFRFAKEEDCQKHCNECLDKLATMQP